MPGARLLSLRWWLPSAVALVAAITAFSVAQFFRVQSEAALRARAEDIAAGSAVRAAAPVANAGTLAQANSRVAERAAAGRVALFLFDPDGELLSPARSRGVAVREVEELAAALEAATGGTRFVSSAGSGQRIVVALPLRTGPAAVLVQVASRPDLVAATSILHERIWIAALLALPVGAFSGLLVSLLITARVRRIGAAASAIASGTLDGKELRLRFPDELGKLASAVDVMRASLRDSFAQLAVERDQLRSLIEQLDEGVIGVDRELRVVVVNRKASALLGLELTVGEPLPGPWIATDLVGFTQSLFVAAGGQRALRMAPTEDRICVITGLPPRAGGTAVLVVTDITEQDRRERAEREFVANAAHELRTPVAAIASAVEMLQTGAKHEPGDRDRFLEIIDRQTSRLGRLGSALLTLARAQGRGEPVQLEPLDVTRLVAGLAEELSLPPESLELAPGAVASGHGDLLRHAVENLVGNARKYACGADLKVVVCTRPGGMVAVEVRDSGPGMGPEQAERIVERFYRGGARGSEGFGLGLSLVREVAEAMNAVLEIETEPDAGTTVRLVLAPVGRARTAA